MSNPYQTLGLQYGATPEEVKAAYRKLAKEFHPDKNPGDLDAEERFKTINAANDQIASGWTPAQQGPRQGPGPGPGGFGFAFHDGSPASWQTVNDIFEGHWYSQRNPPRPKNKDVSAHCEMTLETAFGGSTVAVSTSNGQLISVTIRPGIRNGQRILVPQAGDRTIPGVAPGDLYVTVSIYPHPVFQREGDHLITIKEIDMFTAMLGSEIPLTGIDGRQVSLKIPESFVFGSQMRLSGFGMPNVESGVRGDLFVRLSLRQTVLTDEQKELIKSAQALAA